MRSKKFIGIIFLLAIIIILIMFTNPPESPEEPGDVGFPKELIEPCIDKEEGDVCIINGTMSREESRCGYVDDLLVCFPHRMPPPHEFSGERPDMGEIQVKMLEACEDKGEGDSCTIEGPAGEEEGTCSFRDSELVCMIERPDGIR